MRATRTGPADVGSFGPNSTNYPQVGGGSSTITTEANGQRTCRMPGTFRNWYTYMSANTLSSATFTARFRKNTADGSSVVTYGSGVTGVMEDLTNTDPVVDGDVYNQIYSTTAGGSGTCTLLISSFEFIDVNVTTTTLPLNGYRGSSGRAFSTASATSYFPFGKDAFEQTSIAEDTQAVRYNQRTVIRNLFIRALSNGRTTDTTVRVRNQFVNGIGIVTYGSGVTGVMEDLTGVDVIQAGQVACLAFTTGTGSGSWNLGMNCVDASTTTGSWTSHCGGGIGLSAGTTYFQRLNGANSSTTTEAYTQYRCKPAGTLRGLRSHVGSNGVSASSTFQSRINGVDGNLLVTYGAGVTGFMEDLTNTDRFPAEALLCTTCVIGAGGTNLNQTFVELQVMPDRTATFAHNVGHRPYPYAPGVPS